MTMPGPEITQIMTSLDYAIMQELLKLGQNLCYFLTYLNLNMSPND